ncbi:unnamed protein product, partial [Closterium sp. NIES-53]
DHFLSVCPTTLTVDLLEQRLLAAETSIVAVGASRGDPRTPVFEGCSPSPLLPSVASAATADLGGFESVGAASAPSGRRRTGRGKGGKGTGGTGGSGGGGGGGSGGGWGGGGRGGGGGGVGSSSGGGGGGRGGGGSGGGGGGAGGGGGGGSGGAGRGSMQRSGSGGGQRQQQQRSCETLSPQQLREVGVLVTAPTFSAPATALFPDATEIPRWGDLSRAGVAIVDLDYDAILAAIYAVSTSDEGDYYLCLPPDPGGEAAALGTCEAAALGASASAAPGAGESALTGTASAQVFHTFTLDSGASRSFFRERTTLTPLSRPVAVSLVDPSGGPVLASFSTVLPCPAAPSSTLSGLYLPSFSTNLVSGADLQDQGVDQFTPASQRVTHCTCARTGRHLATFTRRPGSSLYTLTTESPPVPASGQVAASSQVFAAASGSGTESAPCSCRLLSHQTLLWHHRLGHPSMPRLRGMASRVLVSGLPRSLPPLPPGPAPTYVPCVEGRQRAAPHSSEFPPTEAALQTLQMDVWGPARVRGQGHERYFLLVVDDYSRYTTVFPLRSKGDVTEVLIDWIRAARLQLRESFGSDFPVLRLHSDRGEEFSSARLGAFCRAQGIRQTFTLPASPQKNGIAERRIGMVMDVARTSMIHAAAPHFLWLFAVQYTAHQLNLQPRVSLPETSPTLRWTGKVGNASAFRVWGSRAFVRDLSADKLSPRAVPCVFLGFPPDAPGWQFYHPTSRRVLSSQDVTFDESVPYYRLFPYGSFCVPCRAPLSNRHNKAMLALCREHRLEQRTKHIALRYFLARELQQRGQLRLAYVASEANTADIFTKALAPGDHQRFCTMLASRLLSTDVTDHSFESTAASALVAELVDFSTACRLDYANALVAESESASPPSVGGECALGTDVLEDWQEVLQCLADDAITGPYSSEWQAAMDAKMASWKSTGTYINSVPPSRANIVDGMWIFRVKRPPGSPPTFKARYVARGLSQQQGVDYFQAFFPTPKMTSVATRRCSVCPRVTFSGLEYRFLAGQPARGDLAVPSTWFHWVVSYRTTLAALGFAPSIADPSLFLRTDTLLLPFYVLVYVDDLVFATADTEALTLVKFELQKRHTLTDLGPLALRFPVLLVTAHSSVYRPLTLSATFGRDRRAEWFVHWDAAKTVLHYLCSTSSMGLVLGGRGPVVLIGHADASWVDYSATQRSSQDYTFSLGSGSVSWQSTRSFSVLSSSCEAEIYAGAMAAQELRWLTYLLTDFGEQPCSPPVLYVDNKAMIALCQEHRLEHRTKHIALRYFLARELQQRSQLRLAYVATRANTADIFTKALPPGDYQRFSTVLGLLALPFLD